MDFILKKNKPTLNGISRRYYTNVLQMEGQEDTKNYQKDTELNSFNYILGATEWDNKKCSEREKISASAEI